ncbi:hypothetical protein AQUCO_00500312v1 [Aquilegia coerulea]|uniref:Uncharacterized protein n=1 Tax=Aquilegia coerulea TaxID=218851 RepID=A0A2G5ERB4_AQUCA|nr:hypothetical protein AQUCO_00500312v1 [Aquilegia coerulea]
MDKGKEKAVLVGSTVNSSSLPSGPDIVYSQIDQNVQARHKLSQRRLYSNLALEEEEDQLGLWIRSHHHLHHYTHHLCCLYLSINLFNITLTHISPLVITGSITYCFTASHHIQHHCICPTLTHCYLIPFTQANSRNYFTQTAHSISYYSYCYDCYYCWFVQIAFCEISSCYTYL